MFVIRKKNTNLFLPEGRNPDTLSLADRSKQRPRRFRSKGAAASVLAMWLGGPFTTWNELPTGGDGYFTQTPQTDRVAADMEILEIEDDADSDHLPGRRLQGALDR